ncbi:MAG: pantetheine-phosphate adenylyltransferase [Coprobacter sp.]|nr:pantetheine-phosphate adenylyltransferase [Coprobacter sp.]
MKKTSEKTAFYPGTFDPFTLGHYSVTRRALQIFDKVIIAVGVNEAKRCLYTPQQRVDMLRKFFADEPRIEVISYCELTVTAARKAQASVILRGIRSVADFEYEKTIADLNRDLSGMDTLLLFTEPAYAHISSSAVRELLHFNQSIDQFIPEGLELPSL